MARPRQTHCIHGHLLIETYYTNSSDNRQRCYECHKRRQREYAQRKGKDFIRSANLVQKYGITLENWEALFNEQNKVCALCGSNDPKDKRGWHTDHCHKTGKVRGILCRDCNIGLGHYEIMLQYDVQDYLGAGVL